MGIKEGRVGHGFAIAGLALASVVFAPEATAYHWCRVDGTVPGTGPSVIAIGSGDDEPYRTVYIDDRDFADLDGDDQAGGIWIYIESNRQTGLQPGARDSMPMRTAFDAYNSLPRVHVDPIVVLEPDPSRPVRPQGLTVFPNGLDAPPRIDQIEGYQDPCFPDDPPPDYVPDELLF